MIITATKKDNNGNDEKKKKINTIVASRWEGKDVAFLLENGITSSFERFKWSKDEIFKRRTNEKETEGITHVHDVYKL